MASGADPWSGIPDDLRKLVDNYAVADFDNRETWGGFRAELEAAEAALCAALRALVADRERLDWLDTFEAEGYGLLSDDAGRWAMSGTGMQNVPEEEAADIWSSFLVRQDEWKESAREAIDAARGAAPKEEEA